MYQAALWHHTTVARQRRRRAGTAWCYAGPAACAPLASTNATSGAVESECGSSFGSSISSPSSSSSPAWRHSPPSLAAVVVAVGLETVVNVVVQLGSAGHTAAAACAAPSTPLPPRAPRRPYRCSHSVESKKTAVTAQQQLGYYATDAAPSPLPAS